LKTAHLRSRDRTKEAIAKHIAINRKSWQPFRVALKAAVEQQTKVIREREAAEAAGRTGEAYATGGTGACAEAPARAAARQSGGKWQARSDAAVRRRH
jgi:hypothetical protein